MLIESDKGNNKMAIIITGVEKAIYDLSVSKNLHALYSKFPLIKTNHLLNHKKINYSFTQSR